MVCVLCQMLMRTERVNQDMTHLVYLLQEQGGFDAGSLLLKVQSMVRLTAGVPQLKRHATSTNVSAMIKVLPVSEHRNLVVQIIP